MTAIRTAPTREVPTHIVSFNQRGHRIIVAVEATDDQDAIRRATELCGPSSDIGDAYNVAQLR